MKKTVDPLFAAYAASAPRLDLAAYILYAGNHEAEYDIVTKAIVRDMLMLHAELSGPKPGSVASQKRRVWQLIDRFKAATSPWRDDQAAAWRTAIEAANAVQDAGSALDALLDATSTPEPPADVDDVPAPETQAAGPDSDDEAANAA